MKKIITIVIVLAAILNASAQELTGAQKRTAGAKVYELFAKYSEFSTLKETGGITDSSLSRFADLFTSDAKIHDDLNDAEPTDYLLTTADKTIAQYLKDNRENYPKGISSKITKASVSFKGLANKEVKIVYERNANATNSTAQTYKNLDTLLMTIKIGDDFNSAKIASIALVSGHLTGPPAKPKCKDDNDCDGVTNAMDKCPNDKGLATNAGCPEGVCPGDDDCDGVLNAVDRCPNEKGTAENNGCKATGKTTCPNDDDCDGVLNFADKCPNAKGPESNGGCPEVAAVGFALSVNLGFGGNINSTGNADLSSLGYSNAKTTLGSSAKISNKVGAGINVGLEFDILFGKQQNLGISTGVLFAANFAQAKSEKFQVEYKAHDSEGNEFRRILTVKQFDEKITFTNVAIPVLFKFRTATSETNKVGFSVEFGPVLSVLASGKSKIDANMDFEAIYGTGGKYLHYSANDSTSDWKLTEAAVTSHFRAGGPYTDVNDYFDKHYTHGYYIGLNQNVSSDGGTIKYKFGFGGMLRLGMAYQISKSLFFNARIYTTIISNSVNSTSTGNKPVDAMDNFKDKTNLNSILNSTKSLLSTQFGINLGIQYKFK